MKVLICHRPGGAFGYISDGWYNCFRERGHKVQRWDGHESSWYDFGPDLYMGCSGHRQPIPPRRNCKIALHVNHLGPANIEGISEPDHAVRWVLTQKPDIVFGYGQEQDRLLWSYWTTKHGLPWLPMPNAADRVLFKLTTPDEERNLDLVYVGGHWAYKGTIIDAYLLPLLTPASGLTYKLHGWGDWPGGVCSGIIPDDQVCNFLNRGRIGPCISERHTHSHGIDIPERAFKVALCGALIIHDPALSLRSLIPSVIIASTPEQFQDYCHYFAKPENSKERLEVAAKQRQEVLAAHTYHHRLASLLAALGFTAEAGHMLS